MSQERFFALTNKTTDLTKIFETNKTLEVQTKKFIKRLDGFIHQSFQKIKITTKCDQRLEELYNKRRYLRNRSDPKSKE